jgi:hypothetical protein
MLQRHEDELKRVCYSEGQKVPSWSWMAYDGRFSYVNIRFEQVFWNHGVQFPSEDVLEAVVRDFQRCRIEEKVSTCTILDELSDQKGWVRFDENSMDVKTLKCIIIGMEKTWDWKHGEKWSDGKRCYVLVVMPRCAEEFCGEYERVGVGFIDGRHISVKGVKARIV